VIAGIIANPHKPEALKTLNALRTAFKVHGWDCVLEAETAAFAEEEGGIPAADFAEKVDVALVLGGDGTMLNAVSRLGVFEKPIAGINIGTLGFLTSCTDGELEIFAEALVQGHYSTSPRTLLEATIIRGDDPVETYYALNEVTLARGDTGRLVSLNAMVNGQLLNNYRADGLIVATPTGSTAYSLSAGGPLIAPRAEVFVITPICPHSLSQRSLVLSDSSIIELSSESTDGSPMLFTVDGRDNARIEVGDKIIVKKSDRLFRLVRLDGRSFYEALRQKLRWQGV